MLSCDNGRLPLSQTFRFEVLKNLAATDLKTMNVFHSRIFHLNRNNTINVRRRVWTRIGMAEWNGIFQLFRFSDTSGQLREANPRFRNFISENLFHSILHPKFPEIFGRMECTQCLTYFICKTLMNTTVTIKFIVIVAFIKSLLCFDSTATLQIKYDYKFYLIFRRGEAGLSPYLEVKTVRH